MQRTPRRVLAALAASVVLVLAGCGGAGYGDPIAATDGGGATTALAPAPVTTPGDAPATGAAPSGGGATPTATGPGTTTSDAPAQGSPDDGDDDGATDDGGSDGGSGDGGGTTSVAAYASDANRFCTGFKDATRTLTTAIAGAGSDTVGVGRAIVRYGDAIASAAAGLRAAPVPDAAAAYHRRTLAWVSGVTAAIRASRSGLQSGSASAGATVVRKVQGLGQPPLGSQVPSALRGRATACSS